MVKPKVPNEKQIKAEIEKLEKMKPRIRDITGFGESNHEKIDVQIEVLKEDLDNDDIWDRWPAEEKDMEVRMSAEEARNWLDGAGDPPSKSWKESVR
jgi:cell fate (sporulation/competence/biofilm development) regulator YlbF (YheA/YmcA/DUF963 family)